MKSQITKEGVVFDTTPILESSKEDFLNTYKGGLINQGICTEETVESFLTEVWGEAQAEIPNETPEEATEIEKKKVKK